jgi:hypothetical protein
MVRGLVPQRENADASAVTAARIAKTIRAGEPVNWTATPVSSAPSASPAVGAALAIVAPSASRRTGASSTSAAVNAPNAVPVATPCTARAAISQPIDVAKKNIPIATSWIRSAPISTGRRPMWSESEPSTSSASRRAIA